MRYLGRLLVYLAIFFFTLSVSSVLIARVIPVTVTPLKVLRLVENFPDKGSSPCNRTGCRCTAINLSMVRAVIATEDNNFLTHRGFDWDAINKALDENREGGRIRGGSTISQQTAKNVFCLPSRTWTRKAVEAYYTFLIETFWDKRRIMEVYLNVIETGENMYGVEAPARQVYGKTAEHAQPPRGIDDRLGAAQSDPDENRRTFILCRTPCGTGALADQQASPGRFRRSPTGCPGSRPPQIIPPRSV